MGHSAKWGTCPTTPAHGSRRSPMSTRGAALVPEESSAPGRSSLHAAARLRSFVGDLARGDPGQARGRPPAEVVVTFGAYVRAARKRAGFTLRDLGELLGISHVFMHEIETGRRHLARSRWVDVTTVLPDVTIDDLAAAAIETALVGGRLAVDPRLASAEEREVLRALLVREALLMPDDERDGPAFPPRTT